MRFPPQAQWQWQPQPAQECREQEERFVEGAEEGVSLRPVEKATRDMSFSRRDPPQRGQGSPGAPLMPRTRSSVSFPQSWQRNS